MFQAIDDVIFAYFAVEMIIKMVLKSLKIVFKELDL